MSRLGLYQSGMGPLLVSLVGRVPGLSHAVLASVDGLPVAVSNGLPEQRADQLAGIGSGLLSIADAAGRSMEAGNAVQAVVEMAAGVLMTAPVNAELTLTLLAVADCDRERLGYALAEFTTQIQPLLA